MKFVNTGIMSQSSSLLFSISLYSFVIKVRRCYWFFQDGFCVCMCECVLFVWVYLGLLSCWEVFLLLFSGGVIYIYYLQSLLTEYNDRIKQTQMVLLIKYDV